MSKRKVRPITVALLAVLALVVLCVGGAAVIGAVVGGPKSTAGSRPVLVVPSSSPAAPVSSPSPTAAAPTTRATSARPATTHRAASASAKPKPTTKKPKPKPTTPAVRMGVHPGAFCSPEGALGLTDRGTLMRCKPSATGSRNRWRKA